MKETLFKWEDPNPLHWLFRHAPGCRDRETLDFRESETDGRWRQRSAVHRRGDEDMDVSMALYYAGT